jgi:hypothetical protein
VAAITPASIGAIPTSAQSGFATLTGGHLTTSQTPALGGDITLAAGAVSAQVVALQGSAIAATAPASGQVLAWNGTQWAPATASTGGGGGANGLTYYLNQGTAADAPTTNIPATPHQLGRTGETGQTTVTTGTLTQNTWVLVAGFVSESSPVDPASTTIPAGLWDFNLWAYGNANAQAGTSIRALAYIYNGTTLTLLGTSGGQVINNSSAQYSLSVLVQQTTVSLTDRIYIAIEAYATGNNHNVTAQFGDGTPSHVHTSLPLVGGTGLWKNSSGVLQSPASLLVDADVDAAAGIALTKIAGAASTAQVAAITPASIGAMATSERATYATTASVAAITAASLGALTTAQSGTWIATTQLGTLATTAQVAAITASSLGALSTAQTVTLAQGGTGATTQAAALTSLGAQSALTSAAPLALTAGGTGTTSAAGALTNLGAQAALTTAAPLALTQGGTGAITAGDALINLGSAGVRLIEATQTVNVSSTMNTGVTPNTLTVNATGVFATNDSYTPVLGDVVLFTNQTGQAVQNGPWVVTTVGATGVQAVFTRPSWFSGTTTKPFSAFIRFGTSRYHNIYIIVNQAVGDISVGSSSIAAYPTSIRQANANLSANTFVNTQTFSAGNLTSPPASFQAGQLITTPAAHRIEWDGSQMYVSNTAAERLPVATSKAQINNQTGTTYTLVLTDAGYLVTLSNASAISVTIPTDASVAFPIGTQILLMQLLAGQVTVSAVTPGTTTVAGKNGLKTSGRYAVISLIKIAANSWIVAGDASA